MRPVTESAPLSPTTWIYPSSPFLRFLEDTRLLHAIYNDCPPPNRCRCQLGPSRFELQTTWRCEVLRLRRATAARCSVTSTATRAVRRTPLYTPPLPGPAGHASLTARDGAGKSHSEPVTRRHCAIRGHGAENSRVKPAERAVNIQQAGAGAGRHGSW